MIRNAITENPNADLLLTTDADEDARLNQELNELGEQLRLRREELAKIEIEWSEFRTRYMQTVGSRYAELEEVERLIAESPGAEAVEETAEEQEAESSAFEPQAPVEGTFQPIRQMRKLFWRVAKMFHPDLAAGDEAERQRRHALMSEANQAYAEGDAERLTSLLEDEQSNVERNVEPQSERLIALRTEIAQRGRELRQVEDEIKRISTLR